MEAVSLTSQTPRADQEGLLALAAGLADAGRPVPPQHLHRLGEDASVHLQRAEQPGRRLPRNPNR